MLDYALVVALLVQSNELEIYESTPPSSIRTEVTARCDNSVISMEYFNVLSGISSVTRIKVGRRNVSSNELERLNTVVKGRRIQTAWVRSCEDRNGLAIPLIAFELVRGSAEDQTLPRRIEVQVISGKLVLEY